MKQFYMQIGEHCNLGLILLLISFSAVAQQPEREVLFSNGRFVTGNNISKKTFKKESLSRAIYGNRYFVLVQFTSIPSKQMQENLKQAGVDLESYLPGKAYLATVSGNFNFALAAGYNISAVNPVPASFKIDPALLNYKPSQSKEAEEKIAVSFYPGIEKKVVIGQLQNAGAVILQTKFDNSDVIFIRAGKAVIDSIAALPFITNIQLQSIRDKALNYNDIGVHGISGLNAFSGRNLNGKGVTIGIGDNADMSTHADFTGRLIVRTPAKPADHGTHVAGTAGGAGIINVKNHGMAPKATLVNQYFSDIITNAPTYITDNNMVLTNNSYYSVEVGCPGTGEYDVLSNYADQQMGQYSQLLHVVAAGNDGANTCSPFPAGFGTVKSGWQSAKNVLTVGAINTSDYSIANFSSRGPLKDGRIKPEIAAGGWAITSTTTNNNYGVNYGTSMASPVVTGALSLMYERYRQLNGGVNPKSSLIKAVACNTAEDLGNAGPDYTFGFGMLNTRRAVEALEGNRYFTNAVSNGGNTTHTITVPANTRRLKILLYWSDSAALVNAASALVNDLDLSVSEPSALLHRPLVLNGMPGGVNAVATEGFDHINNIEQVVVENPAAGTYTIRINGFEVPFGTQEYIISYEIVQAAVVVEYPFGGEKLVPGEAENIRWSANGSDANNFTVEYSLNNGSNWTIINNNVPAADRKYTWTIPAAVNTSQALIRVSRNGTALSGQSNFNFTILGSPVIAATSVCEGAVQLNWPAVSGATSYDILKLSGDSMQVIANTTSTDYIVKGLNKNAMAWLGVAAKNGAGSGRRSVSAGIVPNSGACTLAAFNNDLKVDSILEPTTARQGFANAGNAVKPFKIAFRNLGAVAVNGPISVSYRYGTTTVTESFSALIGVGETYNYTFTGMYPVIASGFKYDFKAWVSFASDGNHLNDTAYKTVKYINNDVITSLPLSEGFEAMPVAEFNLPEMAIGENKRLDFSASTARGRARTFVNTGFAYSGNKAITLDQSPYSAGINTDSFTISYNLSNYTSKQLRFDFFYKNHGQDDAPGNRVWVRGSEGNSWVQAYDLFASQGELSTWKRAIININDVLGSAMPPQTVTPTFQVKIGQSGNTSANTSDAIVDIDDGYTFDDFTLNEVVNDVGLIKITSPDANGCSLGSANPISIQLKNYNNTALNNFPVSYRVNGGAIVTENIASIGANQTLNFTFAQTANLSAYTDYIINVWVKYPGDSYPANDSILNAEFHNSPVISSYPYLENFENNDGYFYAKGTYSSWQWGTPANATINKAASGTKAWVTGLADNYNDNETSFLYSPCFNISGLTQPVLSFSHILSTEPNYDYSWVEYSNDGLVWQKLGNVGQGTNWYDEVSLNNWAASSTRWHVSSINLPVSSTNIRFRFVMSSDAGVTEEGIGIDDIHVFDKAAVYTGIPVTGISQNVNSGNWVHFSSGGNRIVSLNSNGANLGITTVQVHPYIGALRNSNNVYYLNRNIVVRTTNAAAGNVGVRFYFTEDEAQDLVKASGCATCLKPYDPYELGVSKYSGKSSDENAVLEDDISGFFQYILPANTAIVPYDNGYYAEFSVNSFSEFWLSTASVKPAGNGSCIGDNIIFASAATGTNYQWQEDNGSGYANISNGVFYTGANTATLQLTSPPSSYSGYQYRCIIDGINGVANTVRFANSWNGSAGTNWFTAANWSCGTVPDQYTDVFVPGGLTNYPVINANTAIKSIHVHPGSLVTLSSSVKLQVNGK